MKKNGAVIAKDSKYIVQSYSRNPAALVRGRGTRVWDADGRVYLDFLTGITVNTLGHAHPAVSSALRGQLAKITHVGNLFYSDAQAELAEKLVKISFGKRVAFVNTGAEANELCIKVARQHGLASGRFEIITFANSFHGRSYGALSASGQDKLHKNMGPLLPGFKYAQFNDLKSVAKLVGKKTCAVMVEPIQGEGGVVPADREFLLGLRRLCSAKNLLLIVDEIQTGLGRTGRMFCYQHFGSAFVPDVMSLGKALGGGLPLAAVVVGPRAQTLIGKGQHGTTMGGNAVACAAGLALLKELELPGLLKRVGRLGEKMRAEIATMPLVKQVRGRGLMIGAELEIPASEVVRTALERGLIVNATAENILRLHPPLNVKDHEVTKAMNILRGSLESLAARHQKD
ncbi:MAG: acetylornithine/succinylornithine family transaminase [candidate division FCPU426 bacterium]